MAVRASLDLSYRALPASAARVYRLMGLYPGTVFEDRLAAATAALSVEDARYLLEVLTDANLLDDAPRAQYRFHDLIRLHAAEMAERDESPRLREQATRRMLDWLLFTVAAASRLAAPYLNDRPPDIEYEPGEPKRFKDSADALDWLEEEFPNLRAAARYAVDHAKDTFAWQLVDATWPLFLHRGHHQERLEFEQLGLGAARRSPDLYAQAKMLDRVGLALRDLGRFDEAADHVGEALEIWRKLPDRTRTASSLHRLGFMAADRHDLDAAIRHFTNALARYQELEDMRGMALTLNDLGSVLTESERSVEAIEHLERARQLLADHPDQYNQMRTIILLGCAHARSGDLHVATDLLDRAVAGMRDIGSRSGEAKALESLGDLAERSGKPDEARRYYLEALRILLPISRQKADRLRRCLARLDSPGKP
jgi:tetratricopeptide (TPR) repeat protein